jgi:hypothetical protein
MEIQPQGKRHWRVTYALRAEGDGQPMGPEEQLIPASDQRRRPMQRKLFA